MVESFACVGGSLRHEHGICHGSAGAGRFRHGLDRHAVPVGHGHRGLRRGRHLTTLLRTLGGWWAGLALCLAVGTVYVSTWGRLVQLRVNGAGLELRYVARGNCRCACRETRCRPCWWAGASPAALLSARGAARWRQPPATAPAVPNCRPARAKLKEAAACVLRDKTRQRRSGPSDTGVLLRRRFAWSAAARPVIWLNASSHERSARRRALF